MSYSPVDIFCRLEHHSLSYFSSHEEDPVCERDKMVELKHLLMLLNVKLSHWMLVVLVCSLGSII